jgi:hypothetical protein
LLNSLAQGVPALGSHQVGGLEGLIVGVPGGELVDILPASAALVFLDEVVKIFVANSPAAVALSGFDLALPFTEVFYLEIGSNSSCMAQIIGRLKMINLLFGFFFGKQQVNPL